MVKMDHLVCEDGHVIFEVPHKQEKFLTDGATYCCTIEGKDYDAVMTKYHEHMNWEPYKPMQ